VILKLPELDEDDEPLLLLLDELLLLLDELLLLLDELELDEEELLELGDELLLDPAPSAMNVDSDCVRGLNCIGKGGGAFRPD